MSHHLCTHIQGCWPPILPYLDLLKLRKHAQQKPSGGLLSGALTGRHGQQPVGVSSALPRVR